MAALLCAVDDKMRQEIICCVLRSLDGFFVLCERTYGCRLCADGEEVKLYVAFCE